MAHPIFATHWRRLVTTVLTLTWASVSVADCLSEQIACTNRCVLNKDQACVYACGNRAQACIQREYERSNASSSHGSNSTSSDQDDDEDEDAQSSAAMADDDSSSASSIPRGPYASWSGAQKQQAAVTLKNTCNRKCRSYVTAAQGGSMRASYEAAACTIACFVNNLPDDYPRIDEYKRAARENYDNAKRLGSNVPVFLGR